jgi:hypothetical protein
MNKKDKISEKCNSIGSRFTGLDMKDLIGGPLSEAAKAQKQLAKSTADFINKVAFDNQNRIRNTTFDCHKKSEEADGTLKNDETNVKVQANNHVLPEHLERVLDVMAANITPQPASSSTVEKDGKEIDGKIKNKA